MCCDLLPANVIEARKRLLQPYDEEVTIWQTFTAMGRRARSIERSALDVNNGGEAAD
jgi:hypothetical protein